MEPIPLQSARRPITAVMLAASLIVGVAGTASAAPAIPREVPRSDIASGHVEPQGGVTLTRIVRGLTQPVYVTHAGDGRLFVVEQPGRIRIVQDTGADWEITHTFLDIRSRVGSAGDEQGLLGLAFHPDYATNGRFYVDYTNNQGDSVVAEYRRQKFNRADPTSRRQVLKVNQPFANHNGGWVGFKGPYLYIAFGDGGSAGDPRENAQDRGTPLGKILRIDPLDPDGSGPRKYSIPASNPFVGRAGLDSIWSRGLRNPWRNSFDRVTGDLWIGDVGQDRYEEVSRRGDGRARNFGWDLLEGRHRYPSGNLCRSNCKTLPIFEYRHTVSGADNCSVTGGYVARRAGADLYGWYTVADLCSGRMWLLRADHQLGDAVRGPFATGRTPSSFGEDVSGRIYLVDLGGSIWRVNGT